MSDAVLLLVGAGVGTGLGVLLGWLWFRSRGGVDAALASELRHQLASRETDIAEVRTQLLEQREQNGKLAAQARFLEERLATERSQLETLQQKFQKDFEGIANKLLVENSSRFGQQSAESLDKLLGPLRENLQSFKVRLDTVHSENVQHTTLLKDQISRIGAEAANLSKALKGDVKVLGNWGENMLDQILEKSGLQQGLHFRRQSTGRDVEGGVRFLDVVVVLPEGKHLVIDSKVSLKVYEEVRELRGPAAPDQAPHGSRGIGPSALPRAWREALS